MKIFNLIIKFAKSMTNPKNIDPQLKNIIIWHWYKNNTSRHLLKNNLSTPAKKKKKTQADICQKSSLNWSDAGWKRIWMISGERPPIAEFERHSQDGRGEIGDRDCRPRYHWRKSIQIYVCMVETGRSW